MVALIGSGMGEDGLLTLKAKKIISRADALVYDRLIDMRILLYARPDALFVRAGKGPMDGGLQQEGINKTLIDLAKKHSLVARLHGGDPFVFGRGGEEFQALQAEGIDCLVIPGVSSIHAALAYAGIPATHREYNSSFHVYTAHKREDKDGLNYTELASLQGVLVFLMGSKSIARISQGLMTQGKSPHTPMALIYSAATVHQRAVFGTLGNAEALMKQENFSSPLVIAIGEGILPQKCWTPPKTRVLFVGEEKSLIRAESLSEGAPFQFIPLPILKTQTLSPSITSSFLEGCSMALFTSPNAVHSMHRIFPFGLWGKHINIGAVGQTTGSILRGYGLEPSFTAFRGSAQLFSLAAQHSSEGSAILVCTAENSRADCVSASEAYKRNFHPFACYRSSPIPWAVQPVQDVAQSCSSLAFTSGAGVEHFFNLIDNNTMQGKTFFALGASASDALSQRGFSSTMPQNPNFSALIECVKEYL